MKFTRFKFHITYRNPGFDCMQHLVTDLSISDCAYINRHIFYECVSFMAREHPEAAILSIELMGAIIDNMYFSSEGT